MTTNSSDSNPGDTKFKYFNFLPSHFQGCETLQTKSTSTKMDIIQLDNEHQSAHRYSLEAVTDFVMGTEQAVLNSLSPLESHQNQSNCSSSESIQTVAIGEIERQVLSDAPFMSQFFTWTHPKALEYVQFVYQEQMPDHSQSTFGDAILAVCASVAELRGALLQWSTLDRERRAFICKRHFLLSQVMKPIWERELKDKAKVAASEVPAVERIKRNSVQPDEINKHHA